MGSWRARIGIVSPSRGDNHVYEFYRIVPENILLTQVATKVKKLTPDNFSQAFDAYEEAALTLAEEGVDIISLGGGPVFLSQGAGSEETLCSRLRKATSLPVITQLSSAIDACCSLKIKRLAIVSPFQETLNGFFRSYFQGKGFEVPLVRGLGIERNIDIGKLPEDAAYHLTMTAFREGPEVDGFFIPCGRWRTASNIDRLEKETGKPVVTAVQASIWGAFKVLGINDSISGYGSLLSLQRV